MKNSRINIKIWIIASLILSLIGCGKADFYQKNVAFDNGNWNAEEPGVFTIDISDTVSRYNMYFLIRHDEQYPFNNIWIRYKYKGPNDSVYRSSDRLDLLMNNDNPIFKEIGRYEIQIEHLMRQETLEGVMQAGLQIEKL